MKLPRPSFSLDLDPTNPGQYFACCGILEVADRLWPGTEAWFADAAFHVFHAQASFGTLTTALSKATLASDSEQGDDKTAPLRLSLPANTASSSFRLDWWLDEGNVGNRLKTWAGQQKVSTIARAMWHTALSVVEPDRGWLNQPHVAHDPDHPHKAVEPFYFDARRYVHPLDVGYSLDTQKAVTPAYPAVEFLCLLGLQRFRPRQAAAWTFEYHTWHAPLAVECAAAVTCGAARLPTASQYRFSILFRDDQKRYKAFSFSRNVLENAR